MNEHTMDRQVEAILKDTLRAEESGREHLANRLAAVLALPADRRRDGIREVLHAHELSLAAALLDTQEALEQTWGGERLERFTLREPPTEPRVVAKHQPAPRPRQTLGLAPGGAAEDGPGDRAEPLTPPMVGDRTQPTIDSLSSAFGIAADERHLRTMFTDVARGPGELER